VLVYISFTVVMAGGAYREIEHICTVFYTLGYDNSRVTTSMGNVIFNPHNLWQN